ncbi:mechanosensitive ion channel family protein [Nodularia harveyana UHCC-0300]|uniref:Mechanosensitive ion channel family protein n=1 Tax=Nodularia harveyana UHCC-0300 TaxID=2974287 RepID=A0ABU5UAN6_9CYAN|nr:mechanosensitive ion channel family protein [Nodularia harveyana]MEA5580224.1 mechanosensitive ion channel family protein [Nodularia harveyana UHCC-0300]
MSISTSLFAQSLDTKGVAAELFTEITANKIFKALISIFIAYAISISIQSFVNWLSERVPRLFRLTIKQSVPFWRGLILIITVVYLLNLFLNLSESNLLALTGTIAVGLGFAFKDYVSSIIAGVVTLFEAPYRVGDRIQIGEHYGEVIGYGLRGVRLQTPDDSTVTIPHNKVWTEPISNANSGQLEAQVVTQFYLNHHVDCDQVIRILYQAAYSSRYTQLKLPIVVVMEELTWCTHFKLRSYPMDARDEFIYQTDLMRRAKQAFAKHGIFYPILNKGNPQINSENHQY